jgi:hypothetical protein
MKEGVSRRRDGRVALKAARRFRAERLLPTDRRRKALSESISDTGLLIPRTLFANLRAVRICFTNFRTRVMICAMNSEAKTTPLPRSALATVGASGASSCGAGGLDPRGFFCFSWHNALKSPDSWKLTETFWNCGIASGAVLTI